MRDGFDNSGDDVLCPRKFVINYYSQEFGGMNFGNSCVVYFDGVVIIRFLGIPVKEHGVGLAVVQ